MIVVATATVAAAVVVVVVGKVLITVSWFLVAAWWVGEFEVTVGVAQ